MAFANEITQIGILKAENKVKMVLLAKYERSNNKLPGRKLSNRKISICFFIAVIVAVYVASAHKITQLMFIQIRMPALKSPAVSLTETALPDQAKRPASPGAATTATPAERPTDHAGQGKVSFPEEKSDHRGPSLSNDDKENRSASFCSSPEGSLHQIALDMFHHSSPPGSASHTKLKERLQAHSQFYIDLQGGIFAENQRNMASMLEGYGLTRLEKRPPKEWINVTLVETPMMKGVCPLKEVECQNRSRILIQTEQYFKPVVGQCHESPNCIVLEFSDRNYRIAQAKGWGDSFALLPVMTQFPSRIAWLLSDDIKPLRERLYDVVFFAGVFTKRRIAYANATGYLENHPNRTLKITKDKSVRRQAAAYGEAKVCLVVHSYTDDSGGEYHRLSEFAPFGCIPVMERFGDTIGIERYSECGRIAFASGPDLMEAAAIVTAKIDQGWYQDHLHVDWWKAGIQWEILLSSALSGKDVVVPGTSR